MNAIVMDNQLPVSVSCGRETRGNICLTHALWCPVSEVGRSEQPETGVRRLDIPRGEPGHFELMQHGCRDWPFVTDLTFQALAKGWDTDRISDFIRSFGDRRSRQRRRSVCVPSEFVGFTARQQRTLQAPFLVGARTQMSTQKSEVENLITKAAKSDKSDDALKFSQAACNAANAMCALQAALQDRK